MKTLSTPHACLWYYVNLVDTLNISNRNVAWIENENACATAGLGYKSEGPISNPSLHM